MITLEEKKEKILALLSGKEIEVAGQKTSIQKKMATKSQIAGLLVMNYYRLSLLLLTMENEGLIKQVEKEGTTYYTC